jgi:hypothetical protein
MRRFACEVRWAICVGAVLAAGATAGCFDVNGYELRPSDQGTGGATGAAGGDCVPETDYDLCLLLGKNCWDVVVTDGCGVKRDVWCGQCTFPKICGSNNVCGIPGAGGNGDTGGTGGNGDVGGTGGTLGAGGSVGGSGLAGSTGLDADITDGIVGVGPDACGGQKVTATSKTVNVLLVIDKSGSMADTPAGFTTSKWGALRTALGESLDPVKGGIAFGLELYPQSPDPLSPIMPACLTNCCAVKQGSVDIGIALGTIALPSILDALSATIPAGGTPTAVALNNALGYFTAGPGKDLPGEKYVLWATDGAPNCSAAATCDRAHCTLNIESSNQCLADGGTNCCANMGMGSACLDDAATVDQISRLRAAGVSTFVIGIPGTELYSTFLDAFALAGGETATSLSDAATEPKYFAVSAAGGVGALTAVFKSFTTLLIKSCELQLGANPPDLTLLNVKVYGNIMAQAGADGWDLDTTTAPPTIRLKGATCRDIETHGAQSVEVTYGCPTIYVK